MKKRVNKIKNFIPTRSSFKSQTRQKRSHSKIFSLFTCEYLNRTKAQVTIFIIIAILIISVIALFFSLKGTLKKEEPYAPEVSPIANFVQECLEETTKQAIYNTALKGGYHIIPENKKLFLYGQEYAYYYFNKTNYAPSKEEIEIELSKYIKENLQECTKDFIMFEEGGYNIEQRDISVDTSLFLDKLAVSLNYPIKIIKGDFSGRLDNFNRDVDTNFYEKYLLVEKIIEEQEKNPNSIPLGFISELAYNNDFTFETINSDNDVFYFLIFNQGEQEEFIYSFAAKYEWGDLK